MAEEDPKEKTEEAEGKPEEAEAKPASKLKNDDTSDLLGGGDDLMDLFGDADDVNEELAALTAGLDEIPMADLLAQVRDIRAALPKK